MASPAPEAPPSDSKPRDSVPEKESKPEINGHATPAEHSTESETPKVNGKTEDHPVANGVDEDVEMNGNTDSTAPSKSDEPAPFNDSKPKTEEAPKEDVDMADATTTATETKSSEEKPAAKEELTEDKSTGPSEEAKKESAATPEADKAAPASSDESALPTSEVDLQPASISQLAIETGEADAADAKPSVEITMEDAPTDATSTTKVPRERDDDAADEPAPKRARTEPKEDEPMSTVVAAAPGEASVEAAAEQEGSFLDRLPRWADAEFTSEPITAYQRREIRKVLGRIKKTKQGSSFKDSVQKLWPALWDSYIAKIEKPTDLAEIDRNLRDSEAYPTWKHFQDELRLIYDNTLAFNGPIHDVTSAARGSIVSIWEDVVTIPTEEPAKPKPVPKHKPPRESRTAAHVDVAPVKQAAAPKPSPVAVEAPKQRTPPQEPAAEVRRASTATEGDRPKRSVRPPKPKDIDYTTKPSRKKLKPELQFAEEVLSDLMHPKNKHINSWFMEAVDAEGLNIPQYYSIIKKPMDLGKVSRMLAAGEITTLKEFEKTVRLIFSNCYTFNGTVDQGNAVSAVAKQLEDYYNSQIKGKDAWLAKHAKANAPPAHASDDEMEDEEEDGEDHAPTGVDNSKEVRELEAKLREESEKLTDLFAADSPNQSLITVQQGILKMVQEALLTAKQNLSQFRQKQDKPSKKASKPAKSKAAGGASGRKQAGNGVPAKKAGGTKKTPKKLTAANKDAIANAINDLEYPHLDRAIDIIKRDTGQNENNDGELELDIDQLSNDALLKLWELCKKVLPGFGKDASGPASPEVTRAQPAKSSGTKPKKNKPMSAKEQEERIAQLRGLRDLYKPGQEPDGQGVLQAPTPTAESSDDSDSEEE